MTDLLDRFIPLPSHMPRLLVPCASRRIQARSFLLYNPYSSKGKLLKALGRIASQTGLFRALLHTDSLEHASLGLPETVRPLLLPTTLHILQSDWQTALNVHNIVFPIFIGTPGRLQKITALVLDEDGKCLAVAKVAHTPQARNLVTHEHAALKLISSLGLRHSTIPTPLAYKNTGGLTWQLQTTILDGLKCPPNLHQNHFMFLQELASLTQCEAPLCSLPFWKSLTSLSAPDDLWLSEAFSAESVFFNKLFEENRQLIHEISNVRWPLVASHGDFAPWNMRLLNQGIAIYDWEYFLPAAPAGWDIMRFLVMVGNLLQKKSFASLYDQLISGQEYGSLLTNWAHMTGMHIPDQKLLATLFMFDLATEADRTAVANGQVHLEQHFPQ